jgi:WD40 repeat protein
MAFSPGGSLLASISHDETLRIWDAESGDCLYTLPRDTHEMCTARFSHDGKLLASVLLHDLNSGRSSIGLWRMPRFWETQ